MATRDLYLNGALLKRGAEADFSNFPKLKLAELSSTPDNASAATVKYVKDQLQVLSAGTVAGQTTQLASHAEQLSSHDSTLSSHTSTLSSHTSTLSSHDLRITTEKNRIDTILNNAGVLDTFAEVVDRINSLDSAQGADILTKFNSVQQQLNTLYSYFGQTQASIAASVSTDTSNPSYVPSVPPPSTTIPWAIMPMIVGGSQFLNAFMAFPAGVSGITYSLVDSAQTVVSLNGNNLTALAAGSTQVRATGMVSGAEVSVTATVNVSA